MNYESHNNLDMDAVNAQYERDREMEIDAESHHTEDYKNKALAEIEIHQKIEWLKEKRDEMLAIGLIPTLDEVISELEDDLKIIHTIK